MAFFFSSRRRHTRLQGDWSSDVCSSDLRLLPFALQVGDLLHGQLVDRRIVGDEVRVEQRLDRLPSQAFDVHRLRSEERRVGTEWSSRWSWSYHRKNIIISVGRDTIATNI